MITQMYIKKHIDKNAQAHTQVRIIMLRHPYALT